MKGSWWVSIIKVCYLHVLTYTDEIHYFVQLIYTNKCAKKEIDMKIFPALSQRDIAIIESRQLGSFLSGSRSY